MVLHDRSAAMVASGWLVQHSGSDPVFAMTERESDCTYPRCKCAFLWCEGKHPPCPVTGRRYPDMFDLFTLGERAQDPVSTPERYEQEAREK